MGHPSKVSRSLFHKKEKGQLALGGSYPSSTWQVTF